MKLLSLSMAMAACLAVVPGIPLHAQPTFRFAVDNVENTAPGQYPVVTFSVRDADGKAYDLRLDPAFTQPAPTSRLGIQIGWSTIDYTNTGSQSELNSTPSVAQPISINPLARTSGLLGPFPDGTYKVTAARPIPPGATGSGTAMLEGHPAVFNAATGLWVAQPVKSAYRHFVITGALAARRDVVDIAKCKACHGTLSLHGSNRTDEPQVCVVCHNPNATDIPYRLPADGVEVSIDFKRMVHGIHAGRELDNPLVIVGFQHSINNYSTVRFPGELKNCANCHLPGTHVLPLKAGVQGSTIDTRSIVNGVKLVNNDPADDVKITPIASVCSSCHDDSETRRHMISGGASFAATQQAIASGSVRENCVSCHGPGKKKDVARVHKWEQPGRRDDD